MKKCLFYFLLCLFYAQPLSAQNSSWEKAIVILPNGDSLKGSVLYRNEADIYLGFTFADSTGARNQFKANEASALILPDYKVEYGSLSFNTKKDTFTILASVVATGTASLYQSQIDPKKFGLNEAETPFFFIQTPKGTFPLLHNRNPTKTEYNKFKGMLNYATGDCNNIQQIERLKYNFDAILDVVLYYNKCKNPDLVISNVRRKSNIPAIVSHQIVVGGVLTSRIVDGEWYGGTYYKKRLNLGFGSNLGYSLQVIYPSISKRISTEFGLGLVYVKYQDIPVNRWNISDDYLAGRFKIIAGYAFSNEAAITPVIQAGPSLEFTTDVFSIIPLANIGFGLNMKRFFAGGLVEFPFSAFATRSFYYLNLKYTFARSGNRNQK